jgi:hypothetical protein
VDVGDNIIQSSSGTEGSGLYIQAVRIHGSRHSNTKATQGNAIDDGVGKVW